MEEAINLLKQAKKELRETLKKNEKTFDKGLITLIEAQDMDTEAFTQFKKSCAEIVFHHMNFDDN